MAQNDIPTQETSGKDAVPAHTPSYEDQLATVESRMTDYDTPLTQAAGYVRDLLRMIIALRGRHLPVDYNLLLTAIYKDIEAETLSEGHPLPKLAIENAAQSIMGTVGPFLARPKQESGERAKTKDLLDVIRMKLERRFQVSDYLMDGFQEDPPARAVVTDVCQDVMAHVREIHALVERALNSIENGNAGG